MSKRDKVKRPAFRTQREGVAFRRHDFARLRSNAQKALKALQKRDPDGEKRLLDDRDGFGAAVAALVKVPEWSNVRLDPRVIADYIASKKPPEGGKEEAMAEYIGTCLDEIVDDQARMGLTVIALSAQVNLVGRNEDRLAWMNLVMLNLFTNPEAKPRGIPILHHLFWLNYGDYVFQRNVMGFVGQVLDPDLLQGDVFREVLAQDWEAEAIDLGGLAESLGVKPEDVPVKVCETTRLTTLAAERFEGFVPDDDLVERTLDVISDQAVELMRAALDNRAKREELEAAAAGLVRQVATEAARAFQAKGYLENLERTLAELEASDAGSLPRELARRAKIVLGSLPTRFNPLFDALLILGVRRRAARDYHESAEKRAEPTEVPGGKGKPEPPPDV
ncbi:MAG TPA: hypothetical protein VM054_10485 [bacterium]|nr:hypothetical protein [bacterium]